MRRPSICFAAMLAFAFPFAVSAATTEKPTSSTTTPAPKKKGTSSEGDPTPRPSAARSGKKSGTSTKPKATPASTDDAAKDDGGVKAAPTKPSSTPREPEQVLTEESAKPAPTRAPAATLEPDDLREFATQPPSVQELISAALALTKLNLTYTYGSAEPAKGGMDCSGTMYYLLRTQGLEDVPRDSSSQYAWARKGGPFFAVVSKSAESFEFDDLRPGDLLFWTGTYETGREIPISHVMLYLGTEKKTKKRVMFGASDGRSYAGIQRWGVSVFDFKMPRTESTGSSGTKVDFVGYARIPGLRDAASFAIAGASAASDAVAEKPEPQPASTAAPKSAARKKSTSPTPSRKSGGMKPKPKPSSSGE